MWRQQYRQHVASRVHHVVQRAGEGVGVERVQVERVQVERVQVDITTGHGENYMHN